MHTVLTRAEVHGLNRQTADHLLNLIERQTIDAVHIAVAERAGKIAFVCQSEAKRKTSVAGFVSFLSRPPFTHHHNNARGYRRASNASTPHLRPATEVFR